MINRKCRKKGVETLIQQVQTTAANPVESEQIDLPEVVLQPLPMNAKVAEQHHFAHGLLEEMLFKRGIFKPYFMGEGKHGKPFLLEHPQIQFNISHCKNAVLCGIGSKPLGVDVETIRPMRERVLHRVLTASEQQEILQSESPELCFLRFWTLKESFVKALGVGISYPMQTLAFSLREPLATEGMQCHVRQGSGEILVSMQEYAAAGAGAGYRFFQGIWEQKQVFSVCIPKAE